MVVEKIPKKESVSQSLMFVQIIGELINMKVLIQWVWGGASDHEFLKNLEMVP